MSARIVFDGIRREFNNGRDSTVAISNIDLTFEPGSFAAIVGPSGCGKSTLLHIAAGLDTRYQGYFAREPANAVLACLFQQPRLLLWQTARKNITVILEARGMPSRAARQRADEMLELVGLSAAADKFPSQLSGGMQQRVALARALSVDPDFLLMDEPFSALDELTAARLRDELVALCLRKPRTILFVTHNIQEACYLAERVVVMGGHPGRIVADIAMDLPRPRRLDDPALVARAAEVRSFIDRGEVATVAA